MRYCNYCGKIYSEMDKLLKDLDISVWNLVCGFYDKALLVKASKMKPDKKKSLIDLDLWYQNQLPLIIKGRKPKYITHEEICKLMKWKLTRGKFRPRLTEMVATNSEEEVKEASIKAFQALPNVSSAIQALTVLKAVGPATASAVLAAGAPKHAAFMADESMQALPGLQVIKYDLPFYKGYMAEVMKIVKHLNKEDPDKCWDPHKVELTLWTCQIAKKMDTDLYNRISKAVESGSKDEHPPKKKLKT